MNVADLVFYIFAGITVISGAVVVFSKNIIYSAFSLLFTFFAVAALYVLLGADFLAATQLLIYVGGVLVLLIFGVMLTHRISAVKVITARIQTKPALLTAGIILLLLIFTIFRANWRMVPAEPLEATTEKIGRLIMTDFLFPFELASVLLLTAMIGAAFIARRERREKVE
ncbi:MAG: NADH-quinone oxidoreductase subunit J [Fidelibacterota bacterium]